MQVCQIQNSSVVPHLPKSLFAAYMVARQVWSRRANVHSGVLRGLEAGGVHHIGSLPVRHRIKDRLDLQRDRMVVAVHLANASVSIE